MKAFFEVSGSASILRYLFKILSESMHECSQSAGEFTASGLEMLLRLSRQPGDW
jgi:hypothetical protein